MKASAKMTFIRESPARGICPLGEGRFHPTLRLQQLANWKICADLRIPRPSGGYGYGLQHGRAFEQVPLPPIPEVTPTEIPLGQRLHAQIPPEPSIYVGGSSGSICGWMLPPG